MIEHGQPRVQPDGLVLIAVVRARPMDVALDKGCPFQHLLCICHSLHILTCRHSKRGQVDGQDQRGEIEGKSGRARRGGGGGVERDQQGDGKGIAKSCDVQLICDPLYTLPRHPTSNVYP